MRKNPIFTPFQRALADSSLAEKKNNKAPFSCHFCLSQLTGLFLQNHF